jgi:hypothetical protein
MRELTFFPLLERYPMTSDYGYRTNPITGASESFHGGVDYGAPGGAPLIAPFDGEVTTGYESGGAGNWLWVANGPDLFKSFHHSGFAVYSGWVTAGTVLAWIDSTGASTGSHAHLELWDNWVRIDPTGYFERAPLFADAQKDWFDMATEEDLRRIVHDELNASEQEMRSWTFKTLDDFFKKVVPLNAIWDDGQAQYEVTFDGEGNRTRRRLRNPDEVNLLKVGRALNASWVVDVSADPRIFHSWPLAPESGTFDYDDVTPAEACEDEDAG